MEQLILRQAAIDALRTCYDTETITMDNGDEYINYGDAVGEIEQLPPIHPEPQYKTNYGFMWLCPKCGLPVHSDYTKCVRCGHNREKGV